MVPDDAVKSRQVERVGREANDRHVARRRLAMDDAVVHHQHVLAVLRPPPCRSWRSRSDRCPPARESATKIPPSRPSGSRSPIWTNSPSSILRNVPSWMTSDSRSARAAATRCAAALARIGVDAVVDGERQDACRNGEQHDRPDDREARASGRADHDQLRIGVHDGQRLRDRDQQRERNDDRDDRRQDERGDLEEGQRRLAAVRDEVDSRQNLRRPDDRKRPEQRRDEELDRRGARCSVRRPSCTRHIRSGGDVVDCRLGCRRGCQGIRPGCEHNRRLCPGAAVSAVGHNLSRHWLRKRQRTW